MSRTNEHGQPIGEPVPDWSPRLAPAHTTLTGRYVELQPVAADHAPALFAALASPGDDASWTYRHDERPADEAAMIALVETWASRPLDVTFAIVPADAGTPAGIATLMRIDPAHGSAEVGAILYARSLRRTRAATEAIHLLARYLFDDLGYRRFEWKLDAHNEPSARAARRLGFTYEGRFRSAMVYKGRNRDTDWFAMTDADWPRIRDAHERWLASANFDEAGRQLTSLSDLLGGFETGAARLPQPPK
jgi:RimJ/RimL family protein N-acetyltransferase